MLQPQGCNSSAANPKCPALHPHARAQVTPQKLPQPSHVALELAAEDLPHQGVQPRQVVPSAFRPNPNPNPNQTTDPTPTLCLSQGQSQSLT